MEEKPLDFSQLCTFDNYKEVCNKNGYTTNLSDVLQQDFTRIEGITYLDHAGATLYPQSLVRNFCQDISRNVYGNPHSYNPSSKLTHDTVERVRCRVLQHFNTTSEEYAVIFTSGCTAALKLIAESFPWRSPTATEAGSLFCYLTDNHTSVVGIRAVTSALGVVTLPVSPQDVEMRAKDGVQNDDDNGCQAPHLFCYPAQSNFSGRKYPLSYVKGIQARQLYPASDHQGQWFVLLDAASYVSCSPLDLQEHSADFIPISFYKMFGFPTGLGALLVRNDSAVHLRKGYFGGGTAAAYLAGEDFYVQTNNISDRFENGTISFLDIIALNHGFEALQTLTGGMDRIQLYTFGLARYTYMWLSSLCHSNGKPVAKIYIVSEFESPSTQGPILNFNLMDCHGHPIGYSQVDKLASLFNIHVRTGCFCNTGACQLFLSMSDQEVKKNLQAGHVCGDNIDLVDGRPTGSVRVSFGYMSTFQDCQIFLKFVVDCFVEKPVKVDEERLEGLKSTTSSEGSTPVQISRPTMEKAGLRKERHQTAEPSVNGYEDNATTRDIMCHGKGHTVVNIYIYPIKSCAAFEVHDWPLGPQGLLYDRGWMVVNGNGVCLSQKREARLCLIQPQVHLPSNTLYLQASGKDSISIPLNFHNETLLSHRVCQSKVCGDRVKTVDCGEEAAAWLSEFLGQPCRLIRQCPDVIRNMKQGLEQEGRSSALSLVNEAQYLMINRASAELLLKRITDRQEDTEERLSLNIQQLIGRFRANLVIDGMEPFEEDDLTCLTIGNIYFQVAGRCGRCQMIGVNQDTGAKTKEPLLSLSVYRKGKVTFGVYLSHQSQKNPTESCTLSVGSSVMPAILG